MRVVVIVRRELRLHDNPLWDGHAEHEIIPVFILDEFNQQEHGDNLKSLFFAAVHHLRVALSRIGGRLYCIHERQQEQFFAHVRPDVVRWCLDWEPHSRQRDASLRRCLQRLQIRTETLSESSLVGLPEKPYYVFTRYFQSYWKPQLAQASITLRPAPKVLRTPSIAFPETELPRPKGPALRFWHSDETQVRQSWQKYVRQHLPSYEQRRNFLHLGDSSQMSPYVRCGLISIRQLYRDAQDVSPTYIQELAWRDFHIQLLFHHPEITELELRRDWRGFPWLRDEQVFQCWRTGQTGIPIVDAGMRQLLSEGWLPNRVRMIVASFLTKQLGLDWRCGERHFYQHLVDADLAQNVANWQWCAGCGADAAPYFRIFNPWLQAKKFDPDGSYIRRYVPELRQVPTAALSDPQRLREYRVDYPPPIVDVNQARKEYLGRVKRFLGRA
ncbi:MAG: deoxyribodipyrimidine photo-lyase [Gemmatales bacterium]|nr:DNA photolyase family protein [Gemmatales bacterium]MDW7993820.1 deoxyribodipyrimidine photo-lyase [Gemmatales bacterium]